MSIEAADYRKSHLAADKPRSYELQFSAPRNVKSLYWQLEQRVLDVALPVTTTKDKSLLDFACGTGRVLGYLQDRFERSVGVDVSETMLGQARQRVDAEFITGDVTTGNVQLAFKPDHITAFRFFLNAQPDLRSSVLCWMHDNLADGGQLLCNFHLNPYSLVGLAMNTMKRMRQWETTPMLSVGEARTLLETHEFHVKGVIGYGYLYYGRTSTWAPIPMLLPIEHFMTRCRLSPRIARNFLIVAEKM